VHERRGRGEADLGQDLRVLGTIDPHCEDSFDVWQLTFVSKWPVSKHLRIFAQELSNVSTQPSNQTLFRVLQIRIPHVLHVGPHFPNLPVPNDPSETMAFALSVFFVNHTPWRPPASFTC